MSMMIEYGFFKNEKVKVLSIEFGNMIDCETTVIIHVQVYKFCFGVYYSKV